MKNTWKKIKGFSLLEAMVSVFLVSFGIVAIFPLLSSGIRETFDSRDQVTAVLLAQEGIEIMRNIRDNWWAEDSTHTGFPPELDSSVGCRVEYNQDTCIGGTKQLKLQSGFYNYSGGVDTKFRRKIIIRDPSSSLRKVISVVIWEGNDSDLPSYPVTSANCNLLNSCVYLEVELTDWGS